MKIYIHTEHMNKSCHLRSHILFLQHFAMWVLWFIHKSIMRKVSCFPSQWHSCAVVLCFLTALSVWLWVGLILINPELFFTSFPLGSCVQLLYVYLSSPFFIWIFSRKWQNSFWLLLTGGQDAFIVYKKGIFQTFLRCPPFKPQPYRMGEPNLQKYLCQWSCCDFAWVFKNHICLVRLCHVLQQISSAKIWYG